MDISSKNVMQQIRKKWNSCPIAEAMGKVIKWQPWKYKHFSNPFLTAQIKFMEQKRLLLVHHSTKTEHNLIIIRYFTSFGVPEVSWQEQKCHSSMSQRFISCWFEILFFLEWMHFQFLKQCTKDKKGSRINYSEIPKTRKLDNLSKIFFLKN